MNQLFLIYRKIMSSDQTKSSWAFNWKRAWQKRYFVQSEILILAGGCLSGIVTR